MNQIMQQKLGCTMYLCLCYAISDKILEDLITRQNIASIQDLQKLCNAGKGCGSCICDLKKFVLARTRELDQKAEEAGK